MSTETYEKKRLTDVDEVTNLSEVNDIFVENNLQGVRKISTKQFKQDIYDDLPIATPDKGGVLSPVVKTDEMTQEVGSDTTGKLFVKPTIIDSELSDESTNPVQNKIVAEKYNEIDKNKSPMMTKTATGTTATTTDAAPIPPLNIIPYGKSEQKQYEGKNYFDKEYASDLNNWASVDVEYYLGLPIYVGAGNTVTMKYHQTLDSGLETIYCCVTLVNLYTSNPKEWLYHPTITNSQNIKVTMTATEDYIYLWCLIDGVQNGDFMKYIGDYLQIEYGEVATDYEPFVGNAPSPSMAYPQHIVSAGQRYINGYQLGDFNRIPTTSNSNVTLTNNGDGSLTIDGNGTSTDLFNVQIDYTHEETIGLLKSGNLNIRLEKIVYPYIVVYLNYANGTKYVSLNTYGKTTSSVNVTSDMLDDTCYLTLRFYGDSGSAIVGGTIKPMLYQDGDGTWEPYTGGVEKVIDVGNVLKLGSGNILDESTITVDTYGYYYYKENPLLIKGGQSYTIKTYGYSVVPDGVFLYTSEMQDYKTVYGKDTLTFTVDTDIEVIIRLWWNGVNGVPPIEDVRTQLEYGDTASPYRPYVAEQTLSIPYVLRGIGDVKDYVDFERKKLVRRIGKVVFSASDSWNYLESNGLYYAPSTKDIVQVNLGANIGHSLFTHYTYNKGIWNDPTQQGYLVNYTNLVVSEPSVSSAEELAEKLAGSEFIYELAEPIETDLTDEDIAQYNALVMNKGYNTLVNDAGCEVELVYGLDTQTYVDTKLNKTGHEPNKILGTDENGNVITKDENGANISVDSSLSSTSTNPVQNKVVTNKFNSIAQELNNVSNTASEALVVAKGANKALTYGDYETMVTTLNVLSSDVFVTGQNLLIITLDVPDLWVSGIATESVEYTYTSDKDFVTDLADGTIQIGYYVLSPLETQKVDLTEYPKRDDYASELESGVIKVSPSLGTNITDNGELTIEKSSEEEIEEKENEYKPITPSTVDCAVKSGLVNNKFDLTNEEKDSVRKFIGISNPITKTASGETIMTTDSSQLPPLSLIPYGKGEQKQYEGHQLFDIETDIPTSYYTVEDGEFYFPDVAAYSVWVENNIIPFVGEENKQYSLSAELKCGTAENFGIGFRYSDGTTSLSGRQTNTNWYSVSVTSESGKTVVGIGFAYVNASSDGYMRDFVLCEGTEALPYEPYVGGQPSPSMAYPQPIVSAGQRLLSGAQLFDVSTIPSDEWIVNNGDGSITFTGAHPSNNGCSANGMVLSDYAPLLEVGKTYTLNALTTSKLKYVYLSGTVKEAWKFGDSKIMTEAIINSIVNWYSDDVGIASTISEIMLNEGTVTKEHEPYTGGVEKMIDVGIEQKLLGGNLFDINKAYKTFVDNKGRMYFKFINGKTYTMSVDSKVADNTWNTGFFVSSNTWTNGVLEKSKMYFTSIGRITKTFTIPNDGVDYYLIPFVGGVPILSQFNSMFDGTRGENLQIEFGEVANPFQPYTEQTLSIPYVLREGDKVEYASGKRVENSVEYVFTGEEVCIQWGGGQAICVTVPMKFAMNKGLCTHYFNKGLDEIFEGLETGFYIHYQYGQICFYDENYDATTFKTMLAEKYAEGNPVKVYATLAEPIETDLTETDLEAYNALCMNKGYNTLVNDAGCEVELEYVCDTQMHIANLEKKHEEDIQTLKNAILSLGGNV